MTALASSGTERFRPWTLSEQRSVHLSLLATQDEPAHLSLSISPYKLPVSPRFCEDSEFSDSWPSGINPDMPVRARSELEGIAGVASKRS